MPMNEPTVQSLQLRVETGHLIGIETWKPDLVTWGIGHDGPFWQPSKDAGERDVKKEEKAVKASHPGQMEVKTKS